MQVHVAEYLSKHYQADLIKWEPGASDLTGIVGHICGMTADELIKKESYKHFHSFSDFLAVVYVASKIDNLCYNLPWGPKAWKKICPPHPSPDCPSAHGGVFDSDSMLIFFYQKIPDKTYLLARNLFHDLIHEYEAYFASRICETYEANPSSLTGLAYSIDDLKKMVIAAVNPWSADPESWLLYSKHLELMEQKRRDEYEEVQRKERQRAEDGKQRRAVKATNDLFNAVRRNDRKGIVGLINKGADVKTAKTFDGESLLEYAEKNSSAGIYDLLKLYI